MSLKSVANMYEGMTAPNCAPMIILDSSENEYMITRALQLPLNDMSRTLLLPKGVSQSYHNIVSPTV